VGAQLRHRGGRVGGLVEKVTGPVREAGFHHFAFGVDLAPTRKRNQRNGGRISSEMVND
jgi:hypothetical protein